MNLVYRLLAKLADQMLECDACAELIKMDFYIPPALLHYKLARRYAKILLSESI